MMALIFDSVGFCVVLAFLICFCFYYSFSIPATECLPETSTIVALVCISVAFMMNFQKISDISPKNLIIYQFSVQIVSL